MSIPLVDRLIQRLQRDASKVPTIIWAQSLKPTRTDQLWESPIWRRDTMGDSLPSRSAWLQTSWKSALLL